MPKPTKIKKINPHHSGISNVFGNRYAPTQLNYAILDGLYQNTILKKIIKKYIANIVPIYFTLTIEDENENRIPELERECKELSSILNRKLYRQMWKSYLLYGTAILYDGNRKEDGMPEEMKQRFDVDFETINIILNAGNSQHQTQNIEHLSPGNHYFIYDGNKVYQDVTDQY